MLSSKEYDMTYEELEILVKNDEHRQLELKKTTGELKDCMHSACAFLNTEGGWLIFGVTPSSLKILGQEVTDNTQPNSSNPHNKFIANMLCSASYHKITALLNDQAFFK